ncbi:MAG: hypothetical protein HC804_09745 [Anaerolineae bacterium]|nr:hypothetical protein [Anaerolineae bacterium]
MEPDEDFDFDFDQYPNFLDAMPGLSDELFPDKELKEDEEGFVEFAFLPLRDIVLFHKW